MNYIEEYNEKIQSGEINACKKLKKVYEHVVSNMYNDTLIYKYNDNLAQKAIGFIENFIIIPKCAGKPLFKLTLWQKALISCIFGFVNKNTGYRQYKEIFLYVGRKNSKSVLGAAIAIYIMLLDNEEAPELYSAATDRQQAKIVWEYATLMIMNNKTLRKRFKTQAHQIFCKLNYGKFVPLSKNSGSLDGLNISTALIDELHSIKDRNMYDVLKGGMYARKQPLTIIMSTGGYVQQDSIFDSKYQEYEAIINGYSNKNYVDETTLPIIYELENKSEVADEKNWIKANPNLGVSKQIEDLRTEYNKATLNEKTLRDLLVKQFNFRESGRDSFFDLNEIRNKKMFDIKEFSGMYFVGGIDLSATQDLTCATAILCRAGDLKIYVEQMYFMPADLLQEHIQNDKVPYDIWVDKGYLRLCSGNTINQHDIVDYFTELQEKHNIYAYKIGYDRWSASYLVKELQETFGEDICVGVSQTFKEMSNPMFESKAWFKAKRIVYNYNPIFEWCLLNTQGVYDTNGNVHPYKNRNLNIRIDGYSSFLDAFIVLLNNKQDLM